MHVSNGREECGKWPEFTILSRLLQIGNRQLLRVFNHFLLGAIKNFNSVPDDLLPNNLWNVSSADYWKVYP